MNFYLHIGVLGAVALNKPTAEPVGKRCTFSALAIIKQTPSVNTIHAMCLLLANDKLFDILAYSIIGGFLQDTENSIELLSNICNGKCFVLNEKRMEYKNAKGEILTSFLRSLINCILF